MGQKYQGRVRMLVWGNFGPRSDLQCPGPRKLAPSHLDLQSDSHLPACAQSFLCGSPRWLSLFPNMPGIAPYIKPSIFATSFIFIFYQNPTFHLLIPRVANAQAYLGHSGNINEYSGWAARLGSTVKILGNPQGDASLEGNQM